MLQYTYHAVAIRSVVRVRSGIRSNSERDDKCSLARLGSWAGPSHLRWLPQPESSSSGCPWRVSSVFRKGPSGVAAGLEENHSKNRRPTKQRSRGLLDFPGWVGQGGGEWAYGGGGGRLGCGGRVGKGGEGEGDRILLAMQAGLQQ